MRKHFNIKIYGQVQGVLFRDTAKRMADELGVRGLVRNERDGTVYVEVEGEEGDLKKFVDWCRVGPSSARVERAEKNEGEICGYEDFAIEA